MNRKSNSSNELRHGEPIPAHLLKRLVDSSNAHTANVLANRIQYPDPDTMRPEDFDDFPTAPITGPFKGEGFFPTVDELEVSGRRGQRGKSKGKGKSGGGGRRPQLPNPAIVAQEVAAAMQNVALAGNTGNLQVGEFNGEFLDVSKARYFQDAYKEVFSHFHVVFLEEVESAGVAHIANVIGYKGICGTANTRNQAVALLVHPRFKIVGGPIEYTQVATVQGIPDLRPALRVDLEDTYSLEKFSVVVLHLKSMRGGPKVTSVVRHKQLDVLTQCLGANYVGFVGGDMNFPLDDPNFKDGDPLYNDGYTLVAANDHTGTQSMGSRIDGFFVKGLKLKVQFYEVFAFFLNPKVTRAFSDHAATKIEVVVRGSSAGAGSGNGGGSTTGASKLFGTELPLIVRVAPAARRTRKGSRSQK